MKSRTIAVPLAIAAVGAAVPQLVQQGAYAADDPYSSSASYQCALTSDVAGAANVTLSLDSVPAQVKPGQKVKFTGKLTITLPSQELLVSTLMLAKGVTIDKANFPLAAKPGTAIKVTTVKGTPADPSTTFTLEAAVQMAAYTVPKGATDITLALPTKGTVANPLAGSPTATGSPDKVAFTVDLGQQGLTKTREMACWPADTMQAPAPVADIPVALSQPAPGGGGSASSGRTGGTGAVGTGGAGALATTAPGPAAAAGGGDLGAPAAGAQGASAPAASAPADGALPAAASADLSNAVVPQATRGRGTFVPSWLLLVLGGLVTLLALGYAVVMGRRLRAATARIDRPGGVGGA